MGVHVAFSDTIAHNQSLLFSTTKADLQQSHSESGSVLGHLEENYSGPRPKTRQVRHQATGTLRSLLLALRKPVAPGC